MWQHYPRLAIAMGVVAILLCCELAHLFYRYVIKGDFE